MIAVIIMPEAVVLISSILISPIGFVGLLIYSPPLSLKLNRFFLKQQTILQS